MSSPLGLPGLGFVLKRKERPQLAKQGLPVLHFHFAHREVREQLARRPQFFDVAQHWHSLTAATRDADDTLNSKRSRQGLRAHDHTEALD
jgi:hypothetical protein